MIFLLISTSGKIDISSIQSAYKEKDDWFVDINFIEELMELKDEWGEIIVTERERPGNITLPTLEISDDYR